MQTGMQRPAVTGIDPSGGFNYAAPGTTGYAQQTMGASQPKPPPGLWDRIMNAVGQGALPKMPGTTIGAPAGQTPPPPPPPFTTPGQMSAPPGLAALFRPIQNPGAGPGNQGLMAQYLALQQLMRGA